MRKGMLAQWRRGILARGLAGAGLLAVPVVAAGAIGFGNSFSGITGGLSAVANGPRVHLDLDRDHRGATSPR